MVGKRIRALIAVVLFPVLSWCIEVKLDIRDSDGVLTNHLIAGQPFSVEVVIHGVHGSTKAPEIEGINAINARNTGMYMTTINGVSTTKYSYQGVMNQIGSFVVGPARVVHQQMEYTTDPITLTVSDEESSAKNKKSKSKELPAFLRLVIDTNAVVVGQKIRAALRFYYQDPATTLANVSQPEFKDFTVKNVSPLTGGTIEIDDTHYRYAEWTWDMYPTNAGELIIPAHNADYEIPVSGGQNGMLGGIFMMMGPRTQKKRLYSNAVKVTVDPLPATTLPVNAIGTFSSFTASISPAHVKEGEGMVLALEIVGAGNVEGAEISPLVLPAELKYYPSHTDITVIDPEKNIYKKRFEYIVQGKKPGEWEIPEQSFVFFDTNKHEYSTLRSSVLSVRVDAADNKQSAIVINDHETFAQATPQKENEASIPLCLTVQYYHEKEPLSLIWLLLLMFAPVMYLYYAHIIHFFKNTFIVYGVGVKKHALSRARNKIKQLCAQQKSAELYHVFLELYAVLLDIPVSSLSLEKIDDYMDSRILDKHEAFTQVSQQKWREFSSALVRATYSGYDQKNNYELCRMALEWIDSIKRLM